MASGRVVWLARYTRQDGTRAYWKPEWNGGRATFEQRRDAQRAIDEAHLYNDRHGWGRPDTVGAYLETWASRHPRPERTGAKYEHRISRVLDVKVEGRPLANWRLRDLRRRHALALVDHLLIRRVVRSPRTSLHELAARPWLHTGYFGGLFGCVMR